MKPTNKKLTILYLISLLFLLLSEHVIASTQEKPDATLRQLLKESISASDSFKDRFDAEVWLLDMSTRLSLKIKDTKKRLHLLRHIHYEATRVDLSPQIVLALIQVESNFDKFAISTAGARGLMQIMPFWLKEIGKEDDNLFNIRTNLRFGCTILRYYLDKEKGNITRALARYNGSLGSYRYTTKVFRALDNRWSLR
ncbi:FIG016425: Soluble lytic murein transglycosylase and related regulatory proteins (some contain LysM/invasin domains) [hydrothermal vent metagenome]|uniref:FIG016425: Soluble lytic murein transglycosylase and related regulatory proteins (Some contain LysM/invasin domains) n=1 Tax=hydrothermal vent metagenome TaxID=652676 RepID=A0A3B0ZXD7_9ZZZZ